MFEHTFHELKCLQMPNLDKHMEQIELGELSAVIRLWIKQLMSDSGAETSLCHHVQRNCGSHPTIYLRDISSEETQAGHQADHSLPTSAKGENVWNYTSTPQCLHGLVLN
jgi:hypothetical protein